LTHPDGLSIVDTRRTGDAVAAAEDR